MAQDWPDTTRTVDFRLAVTFALNEMPGKFMPLAGSRSSYSDKKVQIEDRFSDLYGYEIDGRNTETSHVDGTVDRRWLAKPKRYAVPVLIDQDDVMTTRVDIKSPIAAQVAKAVRRYQDDQWLLGYYGAALTGEEGATTVAFKSSNIMAVDYASTGTPKGLTLEKLIGMRKLMMQRLVDVEMEKPHVIVTAEQVEDLLSIPQIQSRDYNPLTMQALQNGEVTDFMGFRFIPAEIGNSKAYPKAAAVTVDGNGYRRVPVFVPSGIHMGVWKDFEGHVDMRPDKHHGEQIAGYSCVRATRVLEDKCFQILCTE